MKQYQTRVYFTTAPLGTCLFHRELLPSQQSFMDMMKCTFFPYLTAYTFTFFWLLTLTFVFVYSLYWSSANSAESSQQFLNISQNALFELGENFPYYIIKRLHYYRLITSIVLVNNFYHFLICSFSIATLSSYIEEIIGFKSVFVLVVISGVGGQLARNILVMKASIQSLTPICGLIGYLLGLYLVNKRTVWVNYHNQNIHMLLFLFAIFTLCLHAAYLFPNISYLSLIFGFLFGFLLFFCDTYQNICRRRGILIVFTIILLCLIILIFFRSNPTAVER